MIILPKEDLMKMRGGDNQACDAILDFMIEFKEWDIGDMPLPTFMALIKRMAKHGEDMRRESKWPKR